MKVRKIILLDIRPDDLVLGINAARWLLSRFQKDAILTYGHEPKTAKNFYAKRNKASITVRPC